MNKLAPIIILSFLLVLSCKKDPIQEVPGKNPSTSLTHIAYNPVDYDLQIPESFQALDQPADNPLTVEGVELGRRLFFDPILSADSTMSCSSCHEPKSSFTDNLPVSTGIDNIAGKRSSMSLLNVAYYNKGLFWDGRSKTLEEQALLPVEDPIELHDRWPNVVQKLQRHSDYPQRFRKAFGIEDKKEISKELAAKAIAQFERILISSGQSRYDKVRRGELFFTDAELNGFDMFFDISPELPDAECGHCHNAPLFTTNEYFNNGIELVATLEDFPDQGLGAVSGIRSQNGKFRAPTLRNIELTAPYMHDGRFQTLEEVLDHYNSGGHLADNLDPLIRPLGLTEQQKADILAFLKTLTDPEFNNNPAFQNPFK